MEQHQVTTIDIDSIVRSRLGKRAKYVPSFVLGGLKRLIHQDFINGYLRQGYVGVDFCEHCLRYLDVKVNVVGLEHIPDDGTRYTFVSNHPLGAIDGVALGMVLGRKINGKIKYLVNDLLMNLKGLAPLCVPVNKLGSQARNLPRLVDEAFASDNHIIMFPAGLCSRRSADGTIQDLPWTKAFVSKSISSARCVVPVHFIGQNSSRFYTVADWSKRLGLKFNPAMILLPDEMYKGQHGTFTVIFGQPIPYTDFDHSKTHTQWAQEVRKRVYSLTDADNK